MPRAVEQLYEDFENHLRNVHKFGQKVANNMAELAQNINSALKNNGSVENEINTFLKKQTAFRNSVQEAQAIQEQLDTVFQQQAAYMQPRKNVDRSGKKLEAGNRAELENSNLKSHPFLEKMDKAIRDAINQVINKPKENDNTNSLAARLTTAFDTAVQTTENEARNEYRHRLNMRMTPSAPRPKLEK